MFSDIIEERGKTRESKGRETLNMLNSLEINKSVAEKNIQRIKKFIKKQEFSSKLYPSKQECQNGIRFWTSIINK